jgi:outer membrane protein assembly factor BamB
MTVTPVKKCASSAFVGLLVLCTASTSTKADDWPFFRGPHYDGVSREDGWNAKFPDAGPRIAWSREVGIGASSIIGVDDRVVTMGNRKNKDEDVVICLSADDGSIVWEFPYANKFEERMFDGGTAATPTTDEGHVYTLSYNGHLHCLKLTNGSVVWKKNVIDDFGGEQPQWKYAGSPCVVNDLLILDIGGNKNSTIALNKKTGKKVWGSGKGNAGYAPPIPFKNGGKDAVLVFKGKAMHAFSRLDGAELWKIPWETDYDVNASSPSVIGDKLFISAGYQTGRGTLYQLGKRVPKKLWRNDDIKTKMSSCAIYEGHVYGISEKKGVLMCISMATGDAVWTEPEMGQYGTLKIAGDKLIILTDSGQLIIADASSEGYNEISSAKVLDGSCWVNPVLSNGRIYCRNNKGKLVCVDVRKE